MRRLTLLALSASSALFTLATATHASADPILAPALASFSVLGAETVTNTGATTLTGNLGVDPGTAITGKATITVNGTNAATIGNPSVHESNAFAELAQSQLAQALTNLGHLGPSNLLPVDLAGLTLTSGVYTVPAGSSNLTGTLTLDGQGNANAFWVFQMPSTLITSPDSVVDVVNTGAGAGLYWAVGSSATLDTATSFQGNILALTSIFLNTGATIGCGRALAHVGEVTMDANTVSIGCQSNGYLGSGLGFDASGNLVDSGGNLLAASAVPEPGTMLLFGTGLAWVVARRRKSRHPNL